MMAELDTKARSMLKRASLYRTTVRIAVLKVLLEARKPLRQDQIARRLGKEHHNKASIYRALHSLLRSGLVHKAYVGGRAWHFELADNCSQRQCHPHFTCTSCGATHCLTDMHIPMPVRRHKGFVIRRQETRLEGLCPGCAEGWRGATLM